MTRRRNARIRRSVLSIPALFLLVGAAIGSNGLVLEMKADLAKAEGARDNTALILQQDTLQRTHIGPDENILDAGDQPGIVLPPPTSNETDPTKRPRHEPVPGERELWAYVLPKPFNWAIFESVSIPDNVDGDKKSKEPVPKEDRDMVLAFLALRGKVVGRKEAPVFLGSWYRKEKDFPQPPSKRPGVPPVIGLPSGEGLGLPTSSIALIFSAIIEYVDRNGNRQFDPLVDKVVKRIDLTEKEWESIQRGSVDVLDSDATMEQPIPELPSYEYPSDDDSNDNGTTSNDAILTLSSTSLTHSHVLRIRAWTPRFPIISNEQGLLLHPKSSLLRLGLKNYRFKDHRSRLAVECHIIASRREENRTLIHTFSGKAGSIVSNGGGAEGAEVSWTTFPSHAHTISEDSGGNTTHASVNLFSVVGQDLEKKEMDLLLSKVPKVVSKSLGQYQSVKARKVVWSFGGEAQAHSMFWNVTIGQGTDAVPYPLNELLPSQQHGPPFTHTILWTVGSVFLFAGIGMIAASVVIGVGRSRRKRTDV